MDFSLYEDINMIYESSVANANIKLIEALTEFTESYEENHYITESGLMNIIVGIKKFIASLITSLIAFKDGINNEMSRGTREFETQRRLRQMYKELCDAKAAGEKTVTMMNLWKMRDMYEKAIGELKGISTRFMKQKYSTMKAMEDDLAEFHEKVEKYDKLVEQISKETIVKSVDDAKKFVEQELTNRSFVFKTIDDGISFFESTKTYADTIEKKREILGPDMLRKHVGIFREIGTAISNFIKKVVAKFLVMFMIIR